MKKALLIMAVCLLAFVPVIAQAEPVHNTLNGAVDMPNLIRFTENLTFGVEGTKGVATNLFYDSFAGIEDDYNYEIYAKVTYTGSLFDFSK
jgi:hypothetical protein